MSRRKLSIFLLAFITLVSLTGCEFYSQKFGRGHGGKRSGYTYASIKKKNVRSYRGKQRAKKSYRKYHGKKSKYKAKKRARGRYRA